MRELFKKLNIYADCEWNPSPKKKKNAQHENVLYDFKGPLNFGDYPTAFWGPS